MMTPEELCKISIYSNIVKIGDVWHTFDGDKPNFNMTTLTFDLPPIHEAIHGIEIEYNGCDRDSFRSRNFKSYRYTTDLIGLKVKSKTHQRCGMITTMSIRGVDIYVTIGNKELLMSEVLENYTHLNGEQLGNLRY